MQKFKVLLDVRIVSVISEVVLGQQRVLHLNTPDIHDIHVHAILHIAHVYVHCNETSHM